MLKKNDIIEIEITDTGSEGEGIGRADGMAFFVVGAIPGDTVRAGVMKLKKTYGYARLIEILKPSPNRVKPRCKVAALCGGCQLQHESYEAQLKFKTDKVLNCLTRIGGLVSEESESETVEKRPQVKSRIKDERKTTEGESRRESAEGSEVGEEEQEFEGARKITLRDPENGEEAVMFETVGASEPFGYRNKSQYPVGKDKTGRTVAGFYRNHSHDIIPCTECALAQPVAGSIMDAVLAYMDKAGVTAYCEAYDDEETDHVCFEACEIKSTTEKQKKRKDKLAGTANKYIISESERGVVRHVLIRTGHATKQVMVCLVICAEDIPEKEMLVGLISDACEKHGMKLESVSCCINVEKTNVIMTDRIKHIWGSDHIVDRIGEIDYRISPLSFFQVNPLQTRVLYSKVEELVKESIGVSADQNSRGVERETAEGESKADIEESGCEKDAEKSGSETDEGRDRKPVIWDMYCGTGSISLALCRVAEKVYGVEIIEAAVRDARENAAMNGIKNVEFFCGPAEDVVPEMYAKDASYGADIVVVDPPRKGCDAKLLECLKRMSPHSIIYVSCDPATLARDIKILRAGGYALKKVMPVDMFPQTVHVETCCLLERLRNAKDHVTFTLDMEDYYRIKDAEADKEKR